MTALSATTTLPGFQNPVPDAQQTFRSLLESLAQPGQPRNLSAQLSPPDGLTPACAATCLTLIDFETAVWLQPGFPEKVRQWLVFHTGCRIVLHPQQAAFALVHHSPTMPDLAEFQLGTAETPEDSTTLLIQVEDFYSGQSVTLKGPGIQKTQTLAPQLPPSFWQQWQTNAALYPLGIDVFFLGQQAVLGLPRSTQMVMGNR